MLYCYQPHQTSHSHSPHNQGWGRNSRFLAGRIHSLAQQCFLDNHRPQWSHYRKHNGILKFQKKADFNQVKIKLKIFNRWSLWLQFQNKNYPGIGLVFTKTVWWKKVYSLVWKTTSTAYSWNKKSVGVHVLLPRSKGFSTTGIYMQTIFYQLNF